ncbi:DNA alkylation repair protein [Nocardioides szechwanensis]|uniref:3-methyladenine DNA glycosylase AlkD n=1 Tax=Nocardioides szechwanensis TaxID=1005944 RepID=A0A1H0HFB6_9ACTN|nr:DNA alkylation repair protein [Nocardioides szechwanensis]GEP34279.1 DNA alkylation repair protein [Nocardioides szechwanensis]SDO17780.1 3-methyladenine DNA glycosylase AlkD [Nocardioides szechwanensis]
MPDLADRELVALVREVLAAAGDPERAVGQQRYMKSAMPYYGVTLPEERKLLEPLFKELPPPSPEVWEATVRALWDEATHREEWYAAVSYAQHPAAAGWLDPESLDLWRHLVTTGAWWDVVDETAANLVGEVLMRHRAEVTPVMRAWAVDEHLWVRRTAVICQLRAKEETDLDLLRFAIESNVDDTTFWLRKAIGWALRQYARTDPEWVRAEVARLEGRLSGLSRREATKHLG